MGVEKARRMPAWVQQLTRNFFIWVLYWSVVPFLRMQSRSATSCVSSASVTLLRAVQRSVGV
jgi:hypothetical protein